MRDLYHQFRKLLSLCFLATSTIILLQACTTSSSSYNYDIDPWINASSRAPMDPAQEIPSDLSVAAVNRQSLGAPESQTSQYTRSPRGTTSRTVKVAILLPLSGSHEKLGQAMLNAAQMAVFDIGHKHFELMPYDTYGTPEGARNATRNALKDGARLVLGPVFSRSVRAAREITQAANINMIAFSTDWTLANNKTYLIGFLPFDQIQRITEFATNTGYRRICMISPTDTYGNAVVAAYQAFSRKYGMQDTCIERFSTDKNELSRAMRRLTRYDQRKAIQKAKEEELKLSGLSPEEAQAAALKDYQEQDPPFDAILMPVGGPLAREIGSFLNHYDLPPGKVKRLGTGLFDDNALAQDSALRGAWFASSEPLSRTKFERRYTQYYNQTPPRLSSLAYDATAFSVILAYTGLQQNGSPAYDRQSITNPNGFSGIDGIFRFRPDGIVERGLAVLEYKNGRISVINQAPDTFQKLAN
ncbi:MAG: penicillin-binding protein activator [Alphaproteobacteria bacterium]